MSESIVDNLLRRKGELEAELAEITRLISFYEAAEHRAENHSRSASPSEKSSSTAAGGKISRARGRPSDVGDAAYSVLMSSGRPMTRGEIARALQAKGLRLPQTDPAKYVGTILWRQQDRFVNLEGEGYWIRGRTRD